MILLIRKRTLANLLLVTGWVVYFSGPLYALSDISEQDSRIPNYFPFSAALGLAVIMMGVVLHIRDISKRYILICLIAIILIMSAIFFFLPESVGFAATIVQGAFLIIIILIAVFERNKFLKNRAKVSFFWLSATLFLGLFHAFGFNLLFTASEISLRFLMTGALNLSMLLFLTFFDLELTQNKIERSMHDKEILLQEVHHRVKNNLMIVSSILRLQSSEIEDEDKLELIRGIETRINSMALIHEQLYRSHSFNSIDFSDYIIELTEMLKAGFNADSMNVEIIVECEPVDLDLNKLIPIGMLVNEIVTNSFKHAFSETEKPLIYIGSRNSRDDACVLMISDNGTGFEGKDYEKFRRSTGFVIIDALATQIGAELSLNSEKGTEYLLVIRKKQEKKTEKI